MTQAGVVYSARVARHLKGANILDVIANWRIKGMGNALFRGWGTRRRARLDREEQR